MRLLKNTFHFCLMLLFLCGLSGCATPSSPDVSTQETEHFSDTSETPPSKPKREPGTIIAIPDFYSPELGTDDNVLRIYLPSDYENTDKSYPVIYMPDGQNLFSSTTATYGKSWGLGIILDKMKMDKKTDGIIIVGIDVVSARRTEEYNIYLDAYHNNGTGLADATSDFYVNTVKPYIDENYRTLTDREHTAILGSSYGAVVTINTCIRHPDTFGYVGMFSYCDNQAPERMTTFLKEHMTPETLNNPYIYFFTGGYDFAKESTINAYDIALENGFEHVLLEQDEDGQHDEYTWSTAFENCLRFWKWI